MDVVEVNERALIVARDWGGIFAPFEAFYIHSIIYSSSRAADAFQRYEVSRALRDTESNQVGCIHEALGHAAALSRFFWPHPRRSMSKQLSRLSQSRAEKLRRAFGLTEGSALRDRRLRDLLEHFDERLDSFLLVVEGGYFFPGPRIGDVALADEPDGQFFKLVDPVRSCFACLGEKYYFGDLRMEVDRIVKLAHSMDESGSRLAKPQAPGTSK